MNEPSHVCSKGVQTGCHGRWSGGTLNLQVGKPIKKGARMKGRPPGVIFQAVAAGKMGSAKGEGCDGQSVGAYVSVLLTHDRTVVKARPPDRLGSNLCFTTHHLCDLGQVA